MKRKLRAIWLVLTCKDYFICTLNKGMLHYDMTTPSKDLGKRLRFIYSYVEQEEKEEIEMDRCAELAKEIIDNNPTP